VPDLGTPERRIADSVALYSPIARMATTHLPVSSPVAALTCAIRLIEKAPTMQVSRSTAAKASINLRPMLRDLRKFMVDSRSSRTLALRRLFGVQPPSDWRAATRTCHFASGPARARGRIETRVASTPRDCGAADAN